MKLAVFDQVMPLQKLEKLNEVLPKVGFTHYSVPKDKMPSVFFPLIDNVSKFLDISSYTNAEIWGHVRPNTQWHFDIDEHLYQFHSKKRYPLASIVFYSYVYQLVGGELYLKEGLRVCPVMNRQVIFSPKVFHKVNEFYGKRYSVLLNLWDEPAPILEELRGDLLDSFSKIT